MIKPSHPAATAASAIGGTSFATPHAWLGSTITGRCVALRNTGTAERSRVLRVAVSKVRIPRSQRITLGLPPAMMYSALINSSWTVEAKPRLRSTGLVVLPSCFNSSKFCMLRAPTWMTSMSAKRSSCEMSMISLTTGIPAFLPAAIRNFSPLSRSPWKA